MTTTTDYFLILDIGTAWTKAFLVDSNSPEIKAYAKLPTSVEDIEFSAKLLISKIKPKTKDPKILVTSTFNEENSLEKTLGAKFIPNENIHKGLTEWFSIQSLENPLVLDGGASNYLKNFRVPNIGAYLSYAISEKDLENYIGNKTFRLGSISEDKRHLEIDEAMLRLAFNLFPDLHNSNKFNSLIITGGILSWSPKPTRLALLLLDIMSTGKVVQVFQDPNGFLNSYGALINQKNTFKQNNKMLKNLGSLVSLGGAGKVTLDYGIADVQEVSVTENEITLIPSDSDQEIKVTIHGEKKLVFKVYGGDWGLILDGRTKPLPLQFGQASTRIAITSWQRALEKVELIKI